MEAVMPRVLAEPGATREKYCSKKFYREKWHPCLLLTANRANQANVALLTQDLACRTLI